MKGRKKGAEAPIGIRKPEGGFRFLTVVQIAMAWSCYATRRIRFIDLRAYWACHEVMSCRCTLTHGRQPILAPEELLGLLGAKHLGSVRGALRRLEKVGLLRWGRGGVAFAISPEQLQVDDLSKFWLMLDGITNRARKVPVPRRSLRLLAGGARSSVAAAMLGHLLCCVYYRSRSCTSEGACKASWIARVFAIDERKVKEARAHLRAIGWLRSVSKPQWYLNRYGARVEVNLAWEQDGSRFSTAESAPPREVFATESAPPDSHRKLPTELDQHQKPAHAGGPAAGVCKEQLGKPQLRDVKLEDLRDTSRLLVLFEQAQARKLVDTSERTRLNFVAAAEHALAIGARKPPALFAWLLREQRFDFITQADEDAAVRRLKEHLHGKPSRSVAAAPSMPAAMLSEDARFVREIRAALRRRGFAQDPFPHVRRQRPEWTRERWDRAVGELEQVQFAHTRAVAENDDAPVHDSFLVGQYA